MNVDTSNRKAAELPAEQDPRWAAVVARDRAADGEFYYSVETTGVYCRPPCAARLANSKNVRLHLTSTDAERAGFRPCRRCKPDQAPLEQQYAAKVARVCRMIETADETPTLAKLAKAAGLSVHHFTASSRRSLALRRVNMRQHIGQNASRTNSKRATP